MQRVHNIFENFNFAHNIYSYLEKKDVISLDCTATTFQNSTKSFLDPKSFTLKDITARFSLYKPRTKGCKTRFHSVTGINVTPTDLFSYHLERDDKKTNEPSFMVTIPVPLKKSYTAHGDRSPVELTRLYLEDYFSTSKLNDDILSQAQDKIHIFIALNAHDNYRNLDISSYQVKQELIQAANQFQKELLDKNYPATILPCTWSVDNSIKEIDYFADGNSFWLNSGVDSIRSQLSFLIKNQHLSQDALIKKLPKRQFPFGTMRNFMFQSEPFSKINDHLSTFTHHVYTIVSDADVVSLSRLKRKLSKELAALTEPNEYYVRLAGGYTFNSNDIRHHIELSKAVKGQKEITRSVLLTQLLNAMDMSMRLLLSKVDPNLAYFSEACTAIHNMVFDKKNIICHGVRKQEKYALFDKLNNSHSSMPDITSKLTKTFYQKRSVIAKVGGQKVMAKQNFFIGLETSSRHDITTTHKSKELGIEFLKATLKANHNTQVKASQINMRFGEVGYGKQTFHQIIENLEPKHYPFTTYLFSEKMKNNPPDKPKVRATGKMIIQGQIRAMMHNVQRTDLPHGDIAMKPSLLGTKKFQENKQKILSFIPQCERLLKDSVSILARINKI